MKWHFKQIATNLNDGKIFASSDLSGMVAKFTLEETLGDERFLDAGDINLQTTTELKPTPEKANWILIYWDEKLYNAYQLKTPFTRYNTKAKRYESRLRSIQSIFYEHLKNTLLEYSNASNAWSFNLTASKVTIEQIRESNRLAPTFTLNRWGFSAGDMMVSMAQQSKTNNFGYSCRWQVNPFPLKNNDGLMILFRGQSVDGRQTEKTAVDHTFSSSDEHKVTWLDIFKLGLYAYNTYLKVRPSIILNQLVFVLAMPRKRPGSAAGAKSVPWIDKTIVKNKYRIDGVKLEGKNFTFTQGNVESQFTFKRKLDIYDPEDQITFNSRRLYWASGDYLPQSGKYNILDAGQQNFGFYESGAIEPNYQGIIQNNDGVEGKIIFNGERVAEKITDGSDVVQVTRINPGEEGVASIEGISL